jgi:hypothetical protein
MRATVIALLLALLTHSVEATAQRDRSLVLYRRGVALLKAGAYEEAIRAFKVSYEHHRHGNTLYAIGEAYRRLGRLRESHRFYALYARTLPVEKQAEFAEKLDRLRLGGVSALLVITRPGGAAVSVDGAPRGTTSPGGLRLSVAAGSHVVLVAGEGHRPERLTLQAEFGEPLTLDLSLQPLPRITLQRVVTDEVLPVAGSSWHPTVHVLAGVAFPRYGAPSLSVQPALSVGLTGGALWRSGRLGLLLHACLLYSPVVDEEVDSRAAAITVAGGLGGRWFIWRLWLEASFLLGAQLLAGVDPRTFLVRAAAPQPGSRTYSSLALRPSIGVGLPLWRGLYIYLSPFALTYSPRIGDFDELAPDISQVLRFDLSIGVGWGT